jgi:phosphoribosyl 1,2-cyclic phosphodiesterase
MSLFVSSLNSGSNGNCYYVGNDEEGILIDGGISCKETEKRLKRVGLSIRKVKAIFVSHEHGDHIHGVPGIAKKHKIPVYITPRTLQNGNVEIQPDFIHEFHAHIPVQIGNISVTAFPKLHDAIDPHSFVIASDTVTVGIFTDIGAACDQVRAYFKQCNAVFLESNYDEHMLDQGPYPYYLKERIRGGKGHLSNSEALNLFLENRHPYLTHLFLSHLSRENNSPRLVRDIFTRVAGTTQIVVNSREKESRLFHIRNVMAKIKSPSKEMAKTQLALF